MTRALPPFALLWFSVSAWASAPADAPVGADRNTELTESHAQLAQRFHSRVYRRGAQHFVVDAHRDRLAIRVREGNDQGALARRAEQALAKVGAPFGAWATLEGQAEVIRPHGLYGLHFSEELELSALVDVARLLQGAPEVEAVYPVAKRGAGRAYYDDRVVVTAEPGRLQEVMQKALALSQGTLLRESRVPHTALIAVGARFHHDALEASRALADLPGVASAEPDWYRELAPLALTDDPLLPEQWHLFRDQSSQVPGRAHISAPDAWDITKGDPSVVVAVFDTGTDLSHEDLVANIVGSFDAAAGDNDASAECSDSPDGRDVAEGCPGGRPYRESHGTSVSGTIAATGDNGIGVTGVCPRCSLLPVRLLGGYAQSSLSTAEAFVRAVDEGAWVINNSWGPGASIYFPLARAEQDAFEYARTVGRDGKGTVILFAAGNETTDVALGAYASSPLTLAVSASTNLDDFAIYSNYGRQIDIAAPSMGGVVQQDNYGIYTTDVTGDDGYASGTYNPSFGGTSAASPVAAGVAALVLSANPSLTAEQVRLALTATAEKIRANQVPWEQVVGQDLEAVFDYDEVGHSLGFGFGRVDAARALAYAATPDLTGALCTSAGCEVCGINGRCQSRCESQEDCPDGSVCRAGSCAVPGPSLTDIGQPCNADCTYCVGALDTSFDAIEICTTTCKADADCPSGFDCRLTEVGGAQICAPGSANAGEPQDAFNCFSSSFGTQLVVAGDDGQKYCTDLCFVDGAGACPYGFACDWAACECTRNTNRGCLEYTCDAVSASRSNVGQVCFPEPGFGVACTSDVDCKTGDYCSADGTCRVDDRNGCSVCQPCSASEDCGERGLCYGLRNADVGVCTRGCQDDEDCPGDAVCKGISTGYGTLMVCAAPDAPGEEVCAPEYQCEVACRDDVPCAAGESCVRGTCLPDADEPDATVDTTPTDDDNSSAAAPASGCGCASTSPAGSAPFALFAWAWLGWRRRARVA